MKFLRYPFLGPWQRRTVNFFLASLFLWPALSFAQHYQQTNLVSNEAGHGAKTVDSNLIDPWGIARGTNTAWWVSDRAAGVSTLYDGEGNKTPLVVTIPHSPQSAVGSPTGLVFNGSVDFEVEPGEPAAFVFASFDGTISAWSPKINPAAAIIKVPGSGNSVLTGATIAQVEGRRFLYVTDLREGKIKVFDASFQPVQVSPEAFEDECLPADFAPFNVQNIGGNLYVAYARQNQTKSFVTFGPGLGLIDIFSPRGRLLLRLERGDWLDAPFGLALAPTDFGRFSHKLLVGQFGSGEILAFDAVTGRFQGKFRDPTGQVISIPGLWAIAFGAGTANSGPANALFFNAGINQGKGGLFGNLIPVADELTQGNDQ